MLIGKCDPNKFICSVKQWFDEVKVFPGKPLHSKGLESEIERAVELRLERERDLTHPSFGYNDLIYAKLNVDFWGGVAKKQPGLYSSEFIERKLYVAQRNYDNLLNAENRLFSAAVKKGDVLPTYTGVLRRLPPEIVYDVGINTMAVVELSLGGASVDDISRKHPEIANKDILTIVNVIDRHR